MDYHWEVLIAKEDIIALWLSVQLASISTLALLALASPLAWWLARTRCRLKSVCLAFVSLPLILPPTVLGFYLLLLMSPEGWGGQLSQAIGLGSLPFSFTGLVVSSMIYSLPFVVQPLYNTFQALPNHSLEVATSLGVGIGKRFLSIVLPLSQRGIVTAAILGFAHTLGEFGIVLMIGGNIPRETRVVSVQLYEHVEALNYEQAHQLAIIMLVVAFVILLGLNRISDSPTIVLKKKRSELAEYQ